MLKNLWKIMAKKIIHRSKNFKTRDVFDMAVVYERHKEAFLKASSLFAPKVEILRNRLNHLEKQGLFESEIKDIPILDGGRQFRGQELDICRQCLNDIALHKDKPFHVETDLPAVEKDVAPAIESKAQKGKGCVR
jgi:hypothetical protein